MKRLRDVPKLSALIKRGDIQTPSSRIRDMSLYEFVITVVRSPDVIFITFSFPLKVYREPTDVRLTDRDLQSLFRAW